MSVLKYYDTASQTYRSLPLGTESVAVADWNYSEDEQIVGSWVNGKPIYRKFVNYYASSVGSNTIDSTMSNSSMTLIKAYGYRYTSGSGSTSIVPFPYYAHNQDYAYVYLTTSSLIINTGVSGTFNIVIEYTKTTDEENSFSVDMLSSGDLDKTCTQEEIDAVLGN